MKETKKIENIYVCRTLEDEPETIDKVMVCFSDQSITYMELPSDYGQLNNDKKQKLIFKQEKFLEEFQEQLLKQDNSLEKIIMVYGDDLELTEYVEEQLLKQMDKDSFISEKTLLQGGTVCTALLSGLSFLANNNFVFISIFGTFSAFSSGVLFHTAIKENKCRTRIDESKNLKKFKLYFSYLMLGINVLIGTSHLKVSYDNLSSFIHYSLSSKKQEQLKENNPFSKNEVIDTEEAVDLLIEVLDDNPLVSDEDLEVLSGLDDFISYNSYLDYEEVYDTFSTLDINHLPDEDRGIVIGQYSRDKNEIYIYKGSYQGRELELGFTLLHEVIHSMGSLDIPMLNEGMTALLEVEFSNQQVLSSIYYDQVLLTKIFCELVGTDTMLEAYTKKDSFIVKEAMLQLNDDETCYNQLIQFMDRVQNNFYYQNFKEGELDSELSEVDVASYLSQYLIPYVESDSITEESRNLIELYVNHIGCNMNVVGKNYFHILETDICDQPSYNVTETNKEKVYKK